MMMLSCKLQPLSESSQPQNNDADLLSTKEMIESGEYSLTIRQDVFPAGTESIIIELSNTSNDVMGVNITLERETDDGWMIIKKDPSVKPSSQTVAIDETAVNTIEFKDFDHDMAPGKYRVLQGSGRQVVGAEFVIE